MKTRLSLIALFLLVALVGFAGEPNKQCSAITKKGTQCTRLAMDAKGLCWQHADMANKAKTAQPKDTITGPKGGRYWLDDKGNKHYVPRKK